MVPSFKEIVFWTCLELVPSIEHVYILRKPPCKEKPRSDKVKSFEEEMNILGAKISHQESLLKMIFLFPFGGIC